jgi:hypothetical protein
VEDDDLGRRDLVEAGGLGHGAAGVVHVGERLEEEDPLAPEVALAGDALEAGAPGGEAVGGRDPLGGHEADVVALAGVLVAGVAQAHPETHARHPPRDG